MIKRVLILLTIMSMQATLVINASGLREKVVPISNKIWHKKIEKSDFEKQVVDFIALNNKYTLNKWYYEKKKFPKNNIEYLSFGGTTEHYIRPVSHHIFTLAFSLKKGIYNPKVTGVSKKEAYRILIQLIRSLAHCHKTNVGAGNKGWGDQWQSALWASQLAGGAWFVWNKLPANVQEEVCNVIEHEADRFIDYKVPYYQDRNGKVIYKGDTKAEENAWNSSMVTTAIVMMPHHKNVEKWTKKNIELQISAYARPSDLNNTRCIDGYVVKDILNGSNANEDGTVFNHGIIHPDYMSAIMFNVFNVWLYKMAGMKPLESSLFNADIIYKTLVKKMYKTDVNGNASCNIYFPQGNDWGGERQANYWLMDVMGSLFHWDNNMKIKAIDWAKQRSIEMKRMFSRDTTGQYYQSIKEDNFPSREEWIGQHLIDAYIGLWLESK